MTETISKSKLKAKMLEIFREIEASGNELIVTDHNKPVLRIVPIKEKSTVEDLFSGLQGKVVYQADRTIVATALQLDCPLITSDHAIRSFYQGSIW